MSKEKRESILDQVSGKVKEVAGKVSGNSHLETEGLLGKAKEVVADVKDVVAGAVDGVKNALDKDERR